MYIVTGVFGDRWTVPSTLSGSMHICWRRSASTPGCCTPQYTLVEQQDSLSTVVWRLAFA